MHSVCFSPHPDLGYSSPSRTTPRAGDPRCVECIRAQQPCIPAGSRRGGNFTHRRRSLNQRSDTTEGKSHQRTPTTNPAPNSNNSMGEPQSQEPLYAELKNPCDALNILARLAANDNTTQGECQGNMPPGEGRPILFEGAMSEAESLLETIGTAVAYQLLHQWVYTCPGNLEYNLTNPATPKTIIPFVPWLQNMFLKRQTFGGFHAMSPSSLQPF